MPRKASKLSKMMKPLPDVGKVTSPLAEKLPSRKVVDKAVSDKSANGFLRSLDKAVRKSLRKM